MRSHHAWSVICLIILLASTVSACKPESTEPDISMQSAWVRAMPPGMSMTAAYGNFINKLPHPVEIHTFGSDSFDNVSLHQTIIEDDVSKMVAVPILLLEPGVQVSLRPGDLHLMMMSPTKQLSPGDQVELRFLSSDGQSFVFMLPVEAR
jgi:copper(I)-binding protein